MSERCMIDQLAVLVHHRCRNVVGLCITLLKSYAHDSDALPLDQTIVGVLVALVSLVELDTGVRDLEKAHPEESRVLVLALGDNRVFGLLAELFHDLVGDLALEGLGDSFRALGASQDVDHLADHEVPLVVGSRHQAVQVSEERIAEGRVFLAERLEDINAVVDEALLLLVENVKEDVGVVGEFNYFNVEALHLVAGVEQI
mmetsp:Transcript_11706/g.17788  ORF Transcript_11706/g.17788 Transcript_11706/m.17788 type:complete len:201 (-) Transcript_11706:1300-1902(-)